jgi:PAS domain S-box-containing protein
MAGLDLEDARGFGWVRGLHPDDREMVYANWQQMVTSEGLWGHEYRFQTPEGRITWVYGVATSQRNAAGEIIGYVGVNTDITARKQAEIALQESEARWRSYIDHAPYAVYLTDENGRYLQVNPEACRSTGYREDELLSLHIPDLLAPESQAEGAAHFQRLMDVGEAQGEMRIRRKSGEVCWISIAAVKLSATRYLGFAQDIHARKAAEEALREASQLNKDIITNAQEGVVVYDRDLHYRVWNPFMEHLSGIPAADVLGRHPLEVFPFLHDVGMIKRLECALAGEPATTIDFPFILPASDHSGWTADTSGPLRNAEGEIIGVIATVQDITARKLTEQALRESEARFGSAFMYAAIGMALVAPDGHWLKVNQSGCDIVGYTEEELLTKTFQDITHPDDLDTDLAYVAQLLAGEIDSYQMEKRYFHKCGHVVWVLLSVSLVKNNQGMPLYFISQIEDITVRKEAEAARQLSEEKYRGIFDESVAAIYVFDSHKHFLDTNQAGLDLLGYSRDELLGMSMPDVDADPVVVLPAHQQLLTGGQLRNYEHRLRRKDGTVITVLNNSQPLTNPNGSVVGMQSTLIDITTLKQAEKEQEHLHAQLQQAQKMESIGRLAGGVAHDFNNMLGAIIGYTELAMQQLETPSPIHADLDEIKRAAERSADLTRQLLAFARKQTVAPKVVNLNDAITGMLKMLQRLIGEDIHLTWQPGADLGQIYLDPAQIDQILANLCVNARDAIHGVGTVTIATRNVTLDDTYCDAHVEATPGAFVVLQVRDNGCGMDAETLAHLFEPFYTTKGVGEGTGLGLATVYGIVMQNGGFIQVASEIGQGTTFHIYFPQYTETSDPPLANPVNSPNYRGTETVLLVEDEPAILGLATRVLEQHGYQVIAAHSPHEALRLIEEHGGAIHLLLTDVIMPEMNGRDLAERLRASHQHLQSIFMSGYTASVIAQHGVLEAGVHFLQKPFSIHDLLVKVREVLDAATPPRPT